MAAAAAVVAVGPAVAVGACGGAGGSGQTRTSATTATAPRRAPARPALCATLHSRITGRVATPAATELSGLVASRTQPGVLWAHNDSGDSARVFALAPDGRLLGEFAVSGAQAVDWEDIAIGRSPDGAGEALYVGDTGDNAAQRPEIVVYVVPEPQARSGAGATAPARRVALRYPGGAAHDAEALLVDPATGRIVIVTKSLGGEADVYVAPRRLGGDTATLRRTGSLALGFGQPVTDASLSADGRTVVLRTYDRALVFTRRRGEMLSAALRRRPCAADVSLASEGQGEAVALARDGRSFYTVPEGTRPAIRRYAPAPGR